MSRHYRNSQTLSNTVLDTALLDRDRSKSIGRCSHTWSRRSKGPLGIVMVMILMEFLTALLLGIQTYKLNHQNGILRSDLVKSQEELHQAIPELQKLRQDLDELIRGKLPHLRKLEYGRVPFLDAGHPKNIFFTKIINRGVLSYEYKLVVQNNTGATLWPEIQLSLFNELGVQVGSTEIGTANPVGTKSQ